MSRCSCRCCSPPSGPTSPTASRPRRATGAFQDVVADPTAADRTVLEAGGAASSQVQDDSSFISDLSPALAQPFKQGFADSMDIVFLMGAGVGLVAFLLLLLMPRVELRATSAASAAAAARAAAGPQPD